MEQEIILHRQMNCEDHSNDHFVDPSTFHSVLHPSEPFSLTIQHFQDQAWQKIH